MPATARCQLLVDPPADGAWNMAVDEILLNTAAATGVATLRFYQWQQPTLSLGYFQKSADRAAHRESLDVAMVRRLSGGGAILHDQELTYSLFLPRSHALANQTQSVYDVVHQTIAATLNQHLKTADSTWRAQLCQQLSVRNASSEPFLCFQRLHVGDIVLQNVPAEPNGYPTKIVGSAQRRLRGAILQHGSILLSRSRFARELSGVAETTDLRLSPADLLPQLHDQLAEHLCLDLCAESFRGQLALQAQQLRQSKYQSPDWTKRR